MKNKYMYMTFSPTGYHVPAYLFDNQDDAYAYADLIDGGSVESARVASKHDLDNLNKEWHVWDVFVRYEDMFVTIERQEQLSTERVNWYHGDKYLLAEINAPNDERKAFPIAIRAATKELYEVYGWLYEPCETKHHIDGVFLCRMD